ncbi:MAG: hypothetical protein RR086_03685 [Clostridia bacterium]
MKFLNLLGAEGLKIIDIAFIAIGALIVFGVIIWIIAVNKTKKKKRLEDEVAELARQEETEMGQLQQEVEKGNCLVLSRNVIYAVGVNGSVNAGSYILKSTVQSVTKFNVRYNGLVSEFCAETPIILAEGDTICGVSHSLVLQATK